MDFKELTSLDIYNLCLRYVEGRNIDKANYRLALHQLKDRGETELLYSIALNISY